MINAIGNTVISMLINKIVSLLYINKNVKNFTKYINTILTKFCLIIIDLINCRYKFVLFNSEYNINGDFYDKY